MNVEQLMKRELAGETEVLREIQPQCHFGHHKSINHYLTWDQARAAAVGNPDHLTSILWSFTFRDT
jgi:hypothetical protein